MMARCLHLQEKIFSFAGTKDRRAVTTQLCTAYKVPFHRLAAVNHLDRCYGVIIGNFEYTDKPIQVIDFLFIYLPPSLLI